MTCVIQYKVLFPGVVHCQETAARTSNSCLSWCIVITLKIQHVLTQNLLDLGVVTMISKE